MSVGRPARRSPHRTPPPSPGTEVRRRALVTLLRVDQGEGSQSALREGLELHPALEGPDRGLLTELVYGVLRRALQLDRVFAPQCKNGLTGMAPEVLWALRLGTLQLGLARVPAYAAISTTIDALRAVRGPSPGPLGFVHAVLRRVAEGDATPVGEALPGWLARRVRQRAAGLGVDGEAWLTALAEPAPLHLHVPAELPEPLLEELVRDTVLVERLPVPGTGLAAAALFRHPAFAARHALAVDLGSAAVARLVEARDGEPVLDIAAGRGVKSLRLAASGAAVTAVDLSAGKLAAAADLAATAGLRITTVAADATQPLPLPQEAFAAVLVDAPCSALGTLRRRPEVVLRRKAADLPRLAVLQLAMLRNAARHVRPGGQLVYAVCSFAEEEGPDVIAAFLRDRPDFAVAPLPAWAAGATAPDGGLATHPLWHGADAFYAASLRRAADSASRRSSAGGTDARGADCHGEPSPGRAPDLAER